MESTQQSERETYRTIVLDQNGIDLLLAPTESGFFLPSVEVPRWQRLAEHLTTAMKRTWGCEAICLFTPDVTPSANHANRITYQVMECWHHTETHDARTKWVPISTLAQDSFHDSTDYLAVQQSLAECDVRARATAEPFAKLGWFRELQTWVEQVTRPLGLQLKGPFCQFNASPSFSLIRFETNGLAIWFKAVGEPNLREFPITLTVAQLFPKYTAQRLAAHPAWNGWLSLEVEGTNLGETQNIAQWRAAAADLAKLQIASIGRQAELLGSGARDLRESVLSNLVSPFLAAMGHLMELQPKVPPAVLTQSELLFVGAQIQEALPSLGNFGIPDTLGHLDLNPGNIIVSPSGSTFVDWAEAYVGNPFFSFGYLLEHFSRMVGRDPTLEAQLIAAYAKPWRALLSGHAIVHALSVAPLLAAFAYAAGSDGWSDQEKLRNPNVAAYLRSLTRRMKREADQLIDRRAPCLS